MPTTQDQFPLFECRGITISDIQTSTVSDIDQLLRGFHQLLGNALRGKATHHVIGHKGEWPHPSYVNGFIYARGDRPIWTCLEINGIVGFTKIDSCYNRVAVDQSCCNACHHLQFRFFEACRREIATHDGDGMISYTYASMKYRSPSVTNKRMMTQSNQIHIHQKRERRMRDTITFLRSTSENIPNVNDGVILGDEKKWKEDYQKMMSRESNIERKEIFEMLFREMAVVRQRKSKTGTAVGHVWSDLMIQFAVYIRHGNGASSGMNKVMWEFISDAFCIPKNGTIMRYSHADTSSLDGPCMETILQNAELFDKKAHDLSHPMRYGKLSVDSHKIKDRFGTSNCIVF